MLRWFLLIILGLACPASAQNEVVLADFEDAGQVAQWTGLAPCHQTSAHASSGTHGLAIEIPKWNENSDEDPRPRVRFEIPANFTKDWSQFDAIAVDLWVDGVEMGGCGIKLEDSTGAQSWTTWTDVKPGRLHEAVLSMEEAAGDIDIKDVRAVVLYALRPPYPYTIIADKLRLLPKKAVPAAELTLTYPNYRGWIFPGEATAEVGARVNAADYGYRLNELQMVLALEGPGFSRKATLPVKQTLARYAVSCQGAPEGAMTLTASLERKRNHAVLQSKHWPVKRLSATEVAAMPVYIDRRNTTMVNGKPFFPLGFYTRPDEETIHEIAGTPFNTLLMYFTDRVPKDKMRGLLDEMQRQNLKLVYCMNDVYPRATYLEKDGWEGIKGNESISNAVVEAYRNHPAVLAWYLNDELPREQLPELLDYYRRVREHDPNHPTLITLCQKKDFAWLWQTTDVLSGDPYPIPRGKVNEVALAMQKAKEPSLGSQPVWLVPQSFAWYQHDPKNTDRARIPSQKDLETGRAPTYEEGRCMTYLGLVHGAKGLIYWCYYNMRMLPQYQEMWAWMKSIGEEVNTLSPMLLTGKDVQMPATCEAAAAIHLALKRDGNDYCLIAVNTETKPVEYNARIPEAQGASIEVQFENRKVSTNSGMLTDNFAPLAVHVYRWHAQEK